MNKKGFTLIELLAVIVILALLSLITTPSVLNIIEDTRKSAAEENARVIANTAENYYAQHTLLHNERVGEIDLTGNTLDYKGSKPYKGYVYFDDSGNAYIKMYQNGYCVINDYDNTVNSTKMEAKECEIKSLIIFIDLGGGTLNQEVLEFEQGDTYGELPIPTRDGYTFIGWFDKEGNPITKDTVIDKSGTIYAKWKANVYTVTLSLPNEIIPETEGWKVINEVPTKEITFDTEYGLLPQPYKDGYTFTGWYTSGGYKINSDSTLIIPNNHTLTGQYTPNKYLITYVYNNGNTDTVQTVTYDTNYNLPTPNKVGYTFLGWYDGSIKIENNSVIKILSDKTYEAKWEANTYEITFKYNDNSTNDTSKIVTYDSNYGELPTPTRIGYTFLGWFDNNNLITKDTKVSILDNQILNAKWDVGKYIVTFKYNDGVTNDTTKEVTYDSTYGTLPNPSRTGYTFNGWYDGSTKYESSTTVKITANQTLTGKWTANTYTVTYVYNNGSSNTTATVTYDGSYTLPSPTKTGYIFQGWFTTGGSTITSESKVTIASDHTLNALWSASGYTLTYNANGGTVTPGTASITYDSTYGTLPTPSRTGYTFKGWYTASSGGTQVTSSTKVTTAGNHSIYAQWNPITYTVVYNANGGSGSMSSVSHTYDVAKNLTANTFTRTGYTFKNWNIAKGGTGTSYANSASVKNLSNTSGATVTLYAQWTAITYTVVYNANGGSGSMSSVSHTYDVAKNLTANAFTRTGYDFSGWATSSSGSVAYANSASVKNLSSTSGATVTLYAKWTAKTFTVTFNANGGTTPTASKTVTYDSTYSTLPTPTKSGYTFVGWFTSASGGTQISASTKVTITSAQTLYAQWKMSTYDIMTTSIAYPVLRVGSSVSGTNTAIQNFVLKSDGTIWTTNSQAKSYGYSGSSSYNYYPTITPVAANATWSQMTGISNVVSINSITLYPTLSVNNITGTMVLIQLFAVKNDGTVWTTSVSAKSYAYSGSSSYNYYPTVTPIAANATWSQMTGITNVENLQVVKADPVFQINSIHGTTALIQLFAVKKDGTVHTTSVSAKSYAYSGSSSYNYYPTVNPIAANATWSQMTGITNVEKLEVTSLHPVFKVGGTNAGIIVVSPHTSGTTVMIQLFAIKKDGTVHTVNVSSQSQGYSGSSSYNYYPTVNPIAANATWSQMTGISNVQNLEIVKMDPVFTVNSVSGTTAFIQVFAVKKDGTMYTTSISNQSQGYSGSSSYNYYPTVNPIAANATWSQMSGITNVEKTSAVSLHPIFGVNSVSGTTAFIQVFAVKKDGTMYTTSISKQSQGYSGSSSYNYYPTISPIAANATWSQMSGISGVSNIENFKMDPVLPVNSVSGTTAFIQVNVVKTDGTIWNTSISPKSYGYSGSSSYNYYPTINPIAANATWSQMTGIKTK